MNIELIKYTTSVNRVREFNVFYAVQRPLEAYLYFTDLMFMGIPLSPNDSQTVSQLNSHKSPIYKWMVKSLETEVIKNAFTQTSLHLMKGHSSRR